MHLSSALAAGLLALKASAFWIPPQVSEAGVTATKELISVLAGVPRTVELNCPGCPFAGVETAEWHNDVENKIHLEFDASPSSGLSINNQSILRSAFDAPAPATLTATQIRTSDGSATQPLPLDFALERLEPLTDLHKSDNMIIPVRFTIFAIGGQSIKVDTIAIDMIRTDEAFMIGRISNIPFEATPGAEACEGASRWSMCRVKAFVSFRMQQMFTAAREHVKAKGGCRGRKHGGPGRMGFWDEGGRPEHRQHGEHEHHGEHADHGHHRHHHRHGRLHRLGRVIHRTLRFFLIPAMLGIIGGLIASAMGMLVGQCIIYIWQACYRRATRKEEQAVVEVLVFEDEKPSLMDEEALPQYHDIPPEYKDIESQIVGDKN